MLLLIRLFALLCVLCGGTQELNSNDNSNAAVESRSNDSNAANATEESNSNGIAVDIDMTMNSLQIRFSMGLRRMPASEKVVSIEPCRYRYRERKHMYTDFCGIVLYAY
jgi:hypothetical protein